MQPISEFSAFIIDQLTLFAPISVRQMFGAECLFRHGVMFAIIDDDTLYVKADDESRPWFLEAGCDRFYYWTRRAGIKKQVALSYYQVPSSALDDSDVLCYWVGLGIQSAQRAAPKRAVNDR